MKIIFTLILTVTLLCLNGCYSSAERDYQKVLETKYSNPLDYSIEEILRKYKYDPSIKIFKKRSKKTPTEFEWVHTIKIYGIIDTEVIEDIVSRFEEAVRIKNYDEIKITFFKKVLGLTGTITGVKVVYEKTIN